MEVNQKISKADVLNGLQQRSIYFEKNIENHSIFKPEYEVSKTITSILEKKDILTASEVVKILALLNDIDKVEHYDGSGWYDYQIQLACFLRLNGFKTEFIDRKLRLI